MRVDKLSQRYHRLVRLSSISRVPLMYHTLARTLPVCLLSTLKFTVPKILVQFFNCGSALTFNVKADPQLKNLISCFIISFKQTLYSAAVNFTSIALRAPSRYNQQKASDLPG